MKKNALILSLIIIGVIGISSIEFFIKPELNRQEQQYEVEQKNPLTHDFQSVLKYKHPYMGNASNLINLNNHLPLQQIGRTYQLYPETLTAEINYEENSAYIDNTMLKQALLYNVTANFVLIDNLQTLKFNFTDRSYTFTRAAVQQWYSVPLADLQDVEIWKQQVGAKLSDHAFLNKFESD